MQLQRFTRPFLILIFCLAGCTEPEPGKANHDVDGGDPTDISDVAIDDIGIDDVDAGHDDTGHTDAGHDASDAELDIVEVDSDDATDTRDIPPLFGPWECDPDFNLDYERYDHVEDLGERDLAQGLYLMVADHFNPGYNAARDYMFETLENQNDGQIECVYTGRRVSPDGTRTPGGFNTEHVWPKSRGADHEPAESDLHHLFPVDAMANNQRADHEFGNVDCESTGCPWGQGGSYRGPSEDDERDPVFEVRPDRRGDIARAIFYFAIRYGIGVWREEESVLRTWHCEDPPDDYERSRNDGVEALQGNRNPFIDRPDFVDRLSYF
ncbi:MAG: endonuclease I family protein [Bradymonadaceae bacterium]